MILGKKADLWHRVSYGNGAGIYIIYHKATDDEDYECSKGERRNHHRQAKLNVIITGTAANNYELNIITLKNADGVEGSECTPQACIRFL